MADKPELDLSKPDIQMLFQDYAQTRRDLQNEYRESSRKIQEERERSRLSLERVQREYADKFRVIEKENEALARALGRLQTEVDKLREENAILKAPKAPAYSLPGREVGLELPGPQMVASGSLPVQAPAPFVLPKVAVVPPAEPTLGKSVPIA